MIKFGTGGWRAVIGDDFTKENICRVAQGICDLMKKEEKTELPVIIGYDRRFLSSSASQWIAEVFSANGIKSWCMLRSVPTPLVMFTVKDKKLHYGVEITASHNPYDYNGIKLITEEGRDASIECTNQLEQLIESAVVKSIPFEEAIEKGFVTYLKAPFNDFIDSILSKLDIESIRKADIRILFDSMHGSATYPMMAMLYSARCTIDIMNSEKDGYFGGNMPAPGFSQSAQLRLRVASEGYDLGIEVDGDGDRIAIIDKDGSYIEANQILVMLYYYLHEYRGWKGPVVRNTATTHMLDEVAKSFGEECYEVPVGFKHISSKLDETDAVLGGESSGGLTVRGHIFGKDSIYAAGLLVEMICATGKSVGEFWKELREKYGVFEMVEDNFKFSPEQRINIENILITEKRVPCFHNKRILKVGYNDGVKFYFDDQSFVICRFSGTEPLLRIFAEDKSKDGAQMLIHILKDFISNEKGMV